MFKIQRYLTLKHLGMGRESNVTLLLYSPHETLIAEPRSHHHHDHDPCLAVLDFSKEEEEKKKP